MQLSKYYKFLVAALGVVLTGLNMAYGSNHTVEIIISIAVALGVYTVKNAV